MATDLPRKQEVIRSYIAICIMIIITSCDYSLERSKLNSLPLIPIDEGQLEFSNAEKLKGLRVNVPQESLSGVHDLVITKDYLVLCHPYPFPNYFDVVRLRDFKLTRSFGKEGDGPNEFSGILKSSTSDSENNVLNFIPLEYNPTYFEIMLDSMIISNIEKYKPLIELREVLLTSVQKVQNNYYVGIGPQLLQRVGIFNDSGTKISDSLSYPFEKKMKHLPRNILGLAYQGESVFNSKTNQVAIFCFQSPNWDIISLKSGKVINSKRSHLRAPEVVDVSESGSSLSVATTSRNKGGFIDISASNQYIYALYSGKSMNEDPENFSYSKYVLVLDWEGQLIRKIELDIDTKIIAITPDDNFLFSVVEKANTSELLKYGIKK